MRLASKLESVKEYNGRYPWLVIVVFLAYLVLGIRLFQLQISQGEKYLALSEQNFVQEQLIPPLRGRILDREGRPLADNRPAYNIYLTPAFLGSAPEQVLVKLEGFLNLSSEESSLIRFHLSKARGGQKFREILIKTDISRDQLALLEGHKMELPGISMRPGPKRDFPEGELLAHLLGYVSPVTERELKENPAIPPSAATGKSGIEQQYESLLRGQFGLKRVVVDSQGRIKNGAEGSEYLIKEADTAPVPGFDLTLTIDLDLQKAAKNAFGERTGSVVAIDVETGAVLVWISQPGFDPNKFVSGISTNDWDRLRNSILDPLLDKVSQASYYPGSTYKIVGALAGLKGRAITPESAIGCSGSHPLGNHVFHCWNRHGHGSVNLRRAIKESCDIFFYTVGERLGYDAIRQMSAQLGFGEKPGTGLGSETAGVLPDLAWHKATHRRGWYTGDTLSHVIGQGDLKVSPLQLAVAYAAVANGGRVLAPKLVRQVSDVDGHLVEVMQTQTKRRLDIAPEQLAQVRNALKLVVNEAGGTGYSSRLIEPTFGGKTGSAQVAGLPQDKRAYDDYLRKDHAWFVGFAPTEHPRIVVVAMSEHGVHGGWVAPIVRDVIAAWYEKTTGLPAKRVGSAPKAPTTTETAGQTEIPAVAD